VFKLFGTAPREPHEWDQSTHPPDEVRRISLLRQAQFALREWGRRELSDDPYAIKDTLRVVDVALHEILDDPAPVGAHRTHFLDGGIGEQYCGRLNDELRRLAPDLNTVGYVPTLIREE
jgi:hypothetical protein